MSNTIILVLLFFAHHILCVVDSTSFSYESYWSYMNDCQTTFGKKHADNAIELNSMTGRSQRPSGDQYLFMADDGLALIFLPVATTFLLTSRLCQERGDLMTDNGECLRALFQSISFAEKNHDDRMTVNESYSRHGARSSRTVIAPHAHRKDSESFHIGNRNMIRHESLFADINMVMR